MKKILLILCINWSINLQAQQVSLTFISSGDIENEIIDVHQYGSKFYTDKTNWGNMQFAYSANLKKVNYGVEITQYDEQLKKVKELSIDNGKKDLGPFRPIVHYGKNAIYVLYFRFTDDDKIKILVSKINPDDLSIIATQAAIEYDQKNQAIWGTVKTIYDTNTDFIVSEDEKQVWVIHASPKLILTSVIDSDLKAVQKTESVPVELQELQVTSGHIGNDGNKVFTYRYKDPKLKDFYVRGLFFQPANQQGTFQNIKLSDGSLPGYLELKLSKNGRKLYLAGEYFGEEYADAGKGVLLAEVNMKTQSFSTPVCYPYTAELRQRVFDLDFAVKRKGENVFRDHLLTYEINEMENGTVVLSADMDITTGWERSTTSYHGPVIHIFIKPGGNANMTLIPKKQLRYSYTGFTNYIYKDKLICLYVDVPKFQKQSEDKKIGVASRLGELIPVANVYDADGKLLSRKMLMENRKGIKGNIEIKYGSKVSDNKFVFLVTESKANMVKYYTAVNQVCYLEIQ